MNAIWLGILILSAALLMLTLVKTRMSWAWVSRFAIHMTAAAAGLYLLNQTGLIPGVHIPVNPATIGTAVLLGLPGIAALAGLQAVLF